MSADERADLLVQAAEQQEAAARHLRLAAASTRAGSVKWSVRHLNTARAHTEAASRHLTKAIVDGK